MTLTEAEEELAILHPERELQVGDETVVVHEYNLRQSMQAILLAGPLLAAISDWLLDETLEDVQLLANMESVFAQHAEQVLALVALSTGRTTEWIADLPEAAGTQLVQTWWWVNRDFFVRRLLNHRLPQILASAARDASTKP